MNFLKTPFLILLALSNLAVTATGSRAFAQNIVIGVAGGSASGKTTFAKRLLKTLEPLHPVLITQDWYFNPSDQPQENRMKDGPNKGNPNYDHPTAMDFSLMREQLAELKHGQAITVPEYDWVTAQRSLNGQRIEPSQIIVFEGIHAFHDPELLAQMDIKVFVTEDADIRLGRRIIRDMAERGKTPEQTFAWYLSMVKPMHEQFIEPSKTFADLVIRGDDAGLATGLEKVTGWIQERLNGVDCSDVFGYGDR